MTPAHTPRERSLGQLPGIIVPGLILLFGSWLPMSLAAVGEECKLNACRCADIDPSELPLLSPTQLYGAYSKTVPKPDGPANVSVYIIPPGYSQAPPDIDVILLPIGGKSNVVRLKPTKNPYLYEGIVPLGAYVLSAFGSGLLAPSRRLVIDRDISGLPLHLGKPGLPYYRMGRGLIPFTPRPDLVAVAFEYNPPDPGSARRIAEVLTKDVPVRVYDGKDGDGLPFIRAGGYVWLLQLGPDADRASVMADIRSHLEEVKISARVGIPIDLDGDHVRVLDNQFVFRVNTDVIETARREISTLFGISSLRPNSFDKSVWVGRLKSDDTPRILRTIDCLVGAGVVATGEPDLLIEFVDHDAVPDGWPDDPGYSKQYSNGTQRSGNHSYQRVREAWNLLYVSSLQVPHIGSGDVYIGSLDRGINPSHPEVSDSSGTACTANDSDGTPQLATCFDSVRQQSCDNSNPSYVAPPDSEIQHGMAVFGIMSACTHNGGEVAAIAPGTHHIAVRRSGTTSTTFYANTLTWMGRLPISCPTPDDPRDPCHWTPINRAADVINCSHGFTPPDGCVGSSCFALPTWIDAAFQALVTTGRIRNGAPLGVVLVYSAGNAGAPVELQEPLAADPRTIAVANCRARNDNDVTLAPQETQAGASNFGAAVDVCALGFNAQTITPLCAQAPCRFGGTSAAAATVSGAIGLILSENPDLKWTDVRDVLRSSARQFDASYGFGLLDVCHAVKRAHEAKAAPGSDLWPNGDPCP